MHFVIHHAWIDHLSRITTQSRGTHRYRMPVNCNILPIYCRIWCLFNFFPGEAWFYNLSASLNIKCNECAWLWFIDSKAFRFEFLEIIFWDICQEGLDSGLNHDRLVVKTLLKYFLLITCRGYILTDELLLLVYNYIGT